ncbi:hypothetical protein EKH55_3769 [Sinorhizobium alkalisoli]|nr:hypothetical protein EKH55_3769 [Sinorhizobium alkalisoli]
MSGGRFRLGVCVSRHLQTRMSEFIRLICLMQSCRREVCPGYTHGLKTRNSSSKGLFLANRK